MRTIAKALFLSLFTAIAASNLFCFESKVVSDTFYSRSLRREMPYAVYLPYKKADTRVYPVIYMLHGMSDHFSTWQPEAHIKQMLDNLIRSGKIKPIIAVFPEGERSYYYNSAQGLWEDYIIFDVFDFMQQNYPIKKGADNRAILGISMGGSGAMRLALKFPSMFSYVFGLSGIYDPGYMRYELSLASKKRLSNLRIYFWAGDNDSAGKYAEKLDAFFTAKKVPHSFELRPGKHDWKQWNPEIKKALMIFGKKKTK